MDKEFNKKVNAGRFDELAHSIFEIREACAKLRCSIEEKNKKLYGDDPKPVESIGLNGGGLIGELEMAVEASKNDIKLAVDFVECFSK